MKQIIGRLAALLLLVLLSPPEFPSAQFADADVVPGWRQPVPMAEAQRRPCPRSASAAASAMAAYRLGDYARAIETSAEALACPDHFPLSRHFELLTLRAEALHRNWRGLRSKGSAPDGAQLIEAAATVETAFSLLRGKELLSRQNSVYRRAEDEAYYLVNELYNEGVRMQTAGSSSRAAVAMEGAIRMMGLVPTGRIDREQKDALAEAAYLTGMHLNALGEAERSIPCLRVAVPRDRDLLAGGADALRAAITIPEDRAVPAYYSLGVLLYNKFVSTYNRTGRGSEESISNEGELDSLIEEAELCLRSGLMLSPGNAELQSVLAQVNQAHRLLH